jgi:lysosomal Pro-X carboxypeptidase
MVMPFAQSGVSDMFLPVEMWDEQENTLSCKLKYGSNPQYDFALDYFGGRNPKKDFKDVSNVIFSNGELDPWHVGGVLYNVTENWKSIAIYITQSAHHLDLREPNAADPDSVKEARLIERAWIQKFIDEYNSIAPASTKKPNKHRRKQQKLEEELLAGGSQKKVYEFV